MFITLWHRCRVISLFVQRYSILFYYVLECFDKRYHQQDLYCSKYLVNTSFVFKSRSHQETTFNFFFLVILTSKTGFLKPDGLCVCFVLFLCVNELNPLVFPIVCCGIKCEAKVLHGCQSTKHLQTKSSNKLRL